MPPGDARRPGRDSWRVKPAILGGKDVLPLADAAGRPMTDEQRVDVDWAKVARQAKLTRQEYSVLLYLWRDESPESLLYLKLACTRAAAEEAIHGVERKLAGLGRDARAAGLCLPPAFDSLRLSGRDRLPSGRRPWALFRTPEYFFSVMEEERFKGLMAAWRPQNGKKAAILRHISRDQFSKITTMHTSDSILEADRIRLARIAERIHTWRLRRDAAEAARDAARKEIQEEMEAAVLADRAPKTAALVKIAAEAEASLAAAETEISASERARASVLALIKQGEAELAARAHERFTAEMKAPGAELMAAIEAAASALVKCDEIRRRYGRTGGLIQPQVAPDVFAGSSKGIVLGNLLNDLARLEHVKALFRSVA